MKIGPIAGDFLESKTPTKRLVLILHGLGGHRDYCYQKMLAYALAENGYNTFRFDFRNCGDSDDVEDPSKGRTVYGTDYEDLNSVYNHFMVEQDYNLFAIVGHSRAVACMFVWQLKNPQVFVPYYINCSGRYDCSEVYKRLDVYPGLFEEGGYTSVAKRYGTKTELWYPIEEVHEYANCNSKIYANINPRSQVLTVFGMKDHIVPVRAAGDWANLFDGRHTLEMVLDADHNFYGTVNGKHVNYNPIVVERILKWLQPEAQLQRWNDANMLIPTNRWKCIEGVINFRDFGGYGSVPSGKLFRSAAMNKITAHGKQQIQELGITDIFDLRSTAELERDNCRPVEIDGIRTHFSPVFENVNWSPQAIVERSVGENGLAGQYEEILEALIASGTFAKITRCLAAGGTILVHCTAGKDRTGVVCALILLAMGVDKYTIAREYELTTIGYRSEREKLAHVFKKLLPADQVAQMLGSTFESMWLTLEILESKYGSTFEYYKKAGVEKEYEQIRSRTAQRQHML